MLSCKTAAEWISSALDRPLPLRQRMALGLHLLACRHCARYRSQLYFLRLSRQHLIRREKHEFSDRHPTAQAVQAVETMVPETGESAEMLPAACNESRNRTTNRQTRECSRGKHSIPVHVILNPKVALLGAACHGLTAAQNNGAAGLWEKAERDPCPMERSASAGVG